MAKVSVIVPVFKVEQYLSNCVEHLINQTLKDIEIILVDDGSPDTCPAICDNYANNDFRIHVIHKTNAGVGSARNEGLKVATGEYVIFCDSDDWMEDTALEDLYNAAKKNHADIMIGDVYMVYSSNTKLVHFYKKEFVTEDKKYITELIKADIYRTYCPCPPDEGYAFGYGGPWNKLVKRELIIENSICFDLKLKGIFDDILYTAHILAKARKICYIQKPVYYYRQVEGSITHSYKPNIVEINDAIFDTWEELFFELEDSQQYREAFYACVLRRIEEAIKLYYNHPKNTMSKKDRVKELSELLNREPYHTAIRKVKINKISKKQKFISVFARVGIISPIIYIVKAT